MGYISILISLLAGATKGFFGKKIRGNVGTRKASAPAFCSILLLK